jgi:hypothetical protein
MKNNPCGYAVWFALSLPFGAGIIEVCNGGGSARPRLILGSEDGGWMRISLL